MKTILILIALASTVNAQEVVIIQPRPQSNSLWNPAGSTSIGAWHLPWPIIESLELDTKRNLAPTVRLSREDIEATNTKMRLYVAGEAFMPSRLPLIIGTLNFMGSSTSLLEFVSVVRKNKEAAQFLARSPEAWVVQLPVKFGPRS